MPLGLVEFKKKYNEVLAREKKAEEFFDDPTVPTESKEKWLPKFYEIVKELSGMMMEFRKLTGSEMNVSEVLDGFIGDSLDLDEY